MRIKTIIDICNCVLLTYALSKNENYSSNLCTLEICETCWEKTVEKANARQYLIEANEACHPCVGSKNTYQVSAELRRQYHDPMIAWHPRAEVRLCIEGSAYTLFQDKHQLAFLSWCLKSVAIWVCTLVSA